jgi:carbamoyl-phosphate synthase small subunit
MSKAILVLEDGRTFTGASFGAEGETFGEMVFNTSMTGLSGDPDRPELRRPDRLHDVSADRQLRRERS